MDPKRVLTFRAVAHHRSFSRAARELSLSQPSVSNQVAALEREVGAPLLERRPGGLKLTPEGEILLGHADAVAERFTLAQAQLAGAVDRQHTRLRIGALPSSLAGLVPAAVAQLRDGHPGTRFTIDEGTSEQLAARIAAGELDLAIAYQDTTWPRREPPGVQRHHLLHERFLVAMAPDHRLAAQPEVALGDLRDDDWTAGLTDGVIVRGVPGRRLRAQPRLAHPRPARDPRADHPWAGRDPRRRAAGRPVQGSGAAPHRRNDGRARRLCAAAPGSPPPAGGADPGGARRGGGQRLG